ncbi:MAG TPA: TonB-dependent receptor [Myxococcota bacterium]|nr:TonB-dependent receptor [Myxococcota bacterium]
MVTLPSRSRFASACFSIVLVFLCAPYGAKADDPPAPADTPAPPTAPTDQSGQNTAPPPQNPTPTANPAHSVGEATVTATRASRTVLETPGNVTVIDRAQIEQSGVRDLPELLRREAGIVVTNTTSGPTGYNVEARGFANGSGGGSSMLVLVDGRRTNEPLASVTDWGLINLDDIDRVEIVRGPTSALYGDNAIGGTIQIFTRGGEGKPQFDSHTVYGAYGNLGGSKHTVEQSLHAGGTDGPLSASLFADYDSSNDYRDRAEFRSRDIETSFRYVFTDRIALSVSGGYQDYESQLPGALTAAQIQPCTAPGIIAGTSCGLGPQAATPNLNQNFDDATVRHASMTLEVTPVDNLLITFSPYTWAKHDTSASGDPSFVFSGDFDQQANGLNTQAQIDVPLFELRNRFIFGSDLRRDDASLNSNFSQLGGPSMPENSRSTRETWALYAQDELRLTDDLLLSAGLRYDEASDTLQQTMTPAPTPEQPMPLPQTVNFTHRPAEWSPRGALTYRISEPASAYVSYSRGFRFPSLSEEAGVFAQNPLLRPQTSDTYETGFKWRSQRVTAGLALYLMEVHNEIILDSSFVDPTSGILGLENVNIERTRHRGFEASLSVRPWDCLELYGSYTLDDTRIVFDPLTDLDGNRVPITPVHRGTVGFVLKLPYDFDIGMNANIVGSRYLANDFANSLPKLPKFAVYDLVAGFRPVAFGERLRLQVMFAIRNLFNRQYSEFGGRDSFVLTPPPTPSDVGFFPSPQRYFVMSVTIRARP